MRRVFILACLLSGCSTWSGDFDCGIGQGMKCASLSKVNKAMDRGEIDLDDSIACSNLADGNFACGKQCAKEQKNLSLVPVHIWIAPHRVAPHGIAPTPQSESLPPLTSLTEDRG